jgi:hypothetical protein
VNLNCVLNLELKARPSYALDVDLNYENDTTKQHNRSSWAVRSIPCANTPTQSKGDPMESNRLLPVADKSEEKLKQEQKKLQDDAEFWDLLDYSLKDVPCSSK